MFLLTIGIAFQNSAKKDGSLFSNTEQEQVVSTEPENTNQNEFIPGSTKEGSVVSGPANQCHRSNEVNMVSDR
ncbi:MAG: hypothetical protein KDD58_12940 [Bdellovibrionales bacterium]|nr:hypothetical protein [Bdellovibrionales bacterium]